MRQGTPDNPAIAAQSKSAALRELAWLFFKLGTTAFGGPAGHLAILEQEVVSRKGWLTHQEFLDLLGASNLIPGPTSTEMAIHIGYRRAGAAGLLVAGCSFIFPAAAIVLAVAWAYVRWGQLPQVSALLYGVKPVVIAILIQAMWRLGRAAVKSWLLAVIALAAAAANLLGGNELAVLFGAAGVAMLGHVAAKRGRGAMCVALLPAPGIWPMAAAPVALWPLFLVFLKIGAVLFGGGYVLVAFLRADLVQRLGWLSESQLLDAVAVGQFTPGPLFTTATFVGYVLAGVSGALVATAGIFLPAFIFVALSGPFIGRLRNSPAMGAFLDGLNVASLALLGVVSWQLGRAALVDIRTIALAAISLGLLLWTRVNSVWLVLAGAVAGLALGR